jgi:hypothetical protein
VPGTEHGDWWSTNGWWIFAGTAAVSLLSKYLIRFRGSHIFNPSNFGLVLCFLLLGPELADPLVRERVESAAALFPPLQLNFAQIFYVVAPVNRNSFGFHPPIISEFLAPHRNDGFFVSCFGHI